MDSAAGIALLLSALPALNFLALGLVPSLCLSLLLVLHLHADLLCSPQHLEHAHMVRISSKGPIFSCIACPSPLLLSILFLPSGTSWNFAFTEARPRALHLQGMLPLCMVSSVLFLCMLLLCDQKVFKCYLQRRNLLSKCHMHALYSASTPSLLPDH